jgi:ubiquinone/menaquinone biosynthesis C-methylase UbiE
MSPTVYDEHVRMYIEFVDRVLAMEPSLFGEMGKRIEQLVSGRLDGARVLDVACGEGWLSRLLAPLGPRTITGIDISSELIEIARARTDAANVSFRMDDAQTLTTVEDGSIDVVVSQMAIMDIPDHRAAFAAVRRVLSDDGAFVFSLLHPCFESPHREGDVPDRFMTDDDGTFTANVVRWYASEGHWVSSSATGVRAAVGSHHRMLSTYVNDLIDAGFELVRLEEPLMDVEGLFAQVPRVMILSARPARTPAM